MPNWRFWDRPTSDVRPVAPVADAPRRFSARPRTDLPGNTALLDPAIAEQLAKLRRRRELVRFDVQQAELAMQTDNPWRERVALVEAALATVHDERETAQIVTEPPGVPLPPIAVSARSVQLEPPPKVELAIGDESFVFEEDLDWAERGFQLARSDLQPRRGEIACVLAAVQVESTPELIEHLEASVLAFATDLRDRALEGNPLPTGVTLADLARPDIEFGGWLDWKGHSLIRARHDRRVAELHAEEQRLLTDRDKVLEELATWQDRLPIARRRLAEVDAEIAELEGEG